MDLNKGDLVKYFFMGTERVSLVLKVMDGYSDFFLGWEFESQVFVIKEFRFLSSRGNNITVVSTI